MNREFSSADTSNENLPHRARQWWQEVTVKAGTDLSGFDPASPLAERIAWARSKGSEIAGVYARCSTKRQSAADQVPKCLAFAFANRLYVPPEMVLVDESVIRHRCRRDGVSSDANSL